MHLLVVLVLQCVEIGDAIDAEDNRLAVNDELPTGIANPLAQSASFHATANVVGKTLKLTCNGSVGHGLGSAEQSLCCLQIFLNGHLNLLKQAPRVGSCELCGEHTPGRPCRPLNRPRSRASERCPR